MVILELIYKKPLIEVEKYLDAHKNFLTKCYEQKLFFASGPKKPRNGGIIFAYLDKAAALELIKQDPFFQHDIAEFMITEFIPTRYSEEFKQVIQSKA